ncbi:hypothetical protein EGW08_009232 [Elysia chlorotica]|uniref:G-protein coupled receptors family 1 profile domain-containing protein n=1 Tax=Elysia chlorotica TaxID=188477 RepID=A0A3S1B9J6_ELYCH|nr:hypothetical protein EGW08_009232 [Elysia chlorotica]
MEYETICYMFVLPILCTFGIAGNIVTLVVLFKERFQGVAYSYLKAIAALDLLSLVFVLPTVTRCSECALRDSNFGPIFEAYLHVFIGDVFVKSSFWTVLIFTTERCVTSCFPTSFLSLLLHRQVWRGREGGVQRNLVNQGHSVTASVTIVLAVAAVENLPTFWNYRIENHNVVRRDILEQHAFFRFYIWFDAIFSCLIPSVALIFLNATLIRFLRRRGRRPAAPSTFIVNGPGTSVELNPQDPSAGAQSSLTPLARRSGREQTRILVTLICIIILMLATILPIFVLNLIGQYAPFTSRQFLNSRVTISILLAVNCSGNFVLYCMLNPRFWALFKTMFRLDRCTFSCNSCRCSCSCCCCAVHPPTARIIVTRVAPAHFHHHQQQQQQQRQGLGHMTAAHDVLELEDSRHIDDGQTNAGSTILTCSTSRPTPTSTTIVMSVNDSIKLKPVAPVAKNAKAETSKVNADKQSVEVQTVSGDPRDSLTLDKPSISQNNLPEGAGNSEIIEQIGA